MILLLLLPFLFSFKLLDVPFVKQEKDFCGPSALSSVLAYYGIHKSQQEIAKYVYIPALKGALITDLENYAKSLGLRTELFQGSLENIKEQIDKGHPVILLVDLGNAFVSVPHYLVVIGYDENYFYVHTGYKPREKMSYQELYRIWSKMGRVALVVYP
ncbi:C39 family peptidase [Thermocrinis minervae]|uniref:Peptidase_C39 like family protein n=1 Tax=Thermocrinis minervae TaxID=381751 RepID=A0A1M6R261_9AQUI|nr:C39 family peptidase [Thermocrinis minervae]SHK26447.1 Peptidase_C39 like family protein [Thermocrinis minervae]